MFEDERIEKIFQIFEMIEKNMIQSISIVILQFVGILPKHEFICQTLKWHNWIENSNENDKNDCDKIYLQKIEQYNEEKMQECNSSGCILPKWDAMESRNGICSLEH